MNIHEEQFACNFIVPQKRERYLSLLGSEKGRRKIVNGLDHCGDIDAQYKILVPIGQQAAENVYKILREKNAPDTCYIISSNYEIDEKEMKLIDALKKTIGSSCGTFISCIAGKLGYFEFEEPNQRYILERK